MLLWGLLTTNLDTTSLLHDPKGSSLPSSTHLPPSPTAIPDLLVPTRTPTAVSTTPKVDSEVDEPSSTPTQTPSITLTTPGVDGEVILPTLTPTRQAQLSPTPNPPTATVTNELPSLVEKPSATPTPSPTVAPQPTQTETVTMPSGNFQIPKEDIFRLGVSLPHGVNRNYSLETLGVGWVMDWNARSDASLPSGIEYMQTVNMLNGNLLPEVSTLTAIAANRRGSTWLISNEPDVRWQNNVEPEVYAQLYYQAYTAIKNGDPTAIVVAGGIAQPSQLRFAYLDMILAAYQSMYGASMPVQAWHIHNYMLREERDSWGVDIPPGISANTGVMYGVDDSGNIAAFKSQIYAFRRWMADRGYGGLPLIVSEYGIPMPPDYGFELDRVSEFIREVWYFFYTATDQGIGNPADGGRLVQRWCWFSLGVEKYPAGNLLIPPAGDWTPLADVWRSMVQP